MDLGTGRVKCDQLEYYSKLVMCDVVSKQKIVSEPDVFVIPARYIAEINMHFFNNSLFRSFFIFFSFFFVFDIKTTSKTIKYVLVKNMQSVDLCSHAPILRRFNIKNGRHYTEKVTKTKVTVMSFVYAR